MEFQNEVSTLELKPVKTTNIIGKDYGGFNLYNNNINDIYKVLDIKPFIEANTSEVSLSHLRNDCIIPVFSKDNEKTMAHQEFIEITQECAHSIFNGHLVDLPEIRASHIIKGRVPTAIYKPIKELKEDEKTIYYERMAFVIRIPSISETINGNVLSLMLGGVRAFNSENLYGKKTYEKFKFFIGFQNRVCCNLCISTDGFKSEIRASSVEELKSKILEVIQNYNINKHIEEMRKFQSAYLTESQFAQLIGKTRLYNYLPLETKRLYPELLLNDGQISTVAKEYYQDKNFKRNEDGSISLWDVYNLFTGANKSSYIDSFADRSVNAFHFTEGLFKALNGSGNYHWFLS